MTKNSTPKQAVFFSFQPHGKPSYFLEESQKQETLLIRTTLGTRDNKDEKINFLP